MEPMPYSWLSATGRDLSDCQEILHAIDRKDWDGAKKDLYAEYYIERRDLAIQQGKLSGFNLDAENIKSWRRQSAFRKFLQQYEKNQLDKFRISGMVTTICLTLVLFFAKAVWEGEYFINFSVDAIVGVIALVITVSQLRIKYRTIKKFTKPRDYILLDVLSLVLCLLLKMWLPANLDFSLFVLLMNYFLQKKRFEDLMKVFTKDNER